MIERLAGILLAVALTITAPTDSPSPASLIDAGHYKRARTIVESRLQANPNDAEAAYLLSEVKENYHDLDAALKLAQKAVNLDGKNAKYHYQLAQVYGEMAQHAGVFKQMGLARHFRNEAEAATSLDPKDVDARMGLLEFYLEAPGIVGGGKDKAQKTAAEIMQIDASQGFMAQARLAQENKDTSGEEAAYRKALQADPRNSDAQVALASVCFQKEKNYAEGERAARAAIQMEPGRADGYVMLATLWTLQGRWADLEATLSQAEKAVPDDWNPYYQAGKNILLQGGDLKRAEGYFRKYLLQEPEGGAPGLADAHWRLGLVLEKESRKSEAVTEIQVAVNMKPDFPEAKKDLKRLK